MHSQRTCSRREFLSKTAQGLAAASAALAVPAILKGKPAAAPPNVVYIICDQLRGDALSCLGHPNARTPNLDRMASSGVLLENCFANNPVCLPSRVSAFSGLYPHDHGCLANTSRKYLQTLEGTLLGHFRDRGYRVGWVGKNHTYERELFEQIDYARIRSREPFRAYNKFVPPYWHCDTYWPDEQCYPHINTQEGIQFINQAKAGEPFFLHLSYFDPHPPYMASAEYANQYHPGNMVIPPYVSPDKLSPRLAEQQQALHYDRITDTDLKATMAYYYAATQWGVDEPVGRVLQALERKGLTDNTIVIFTSDHGDFMGQHRMVRKGMFLYDTLLHVPMIWYAPGLIGKGLRVRELAQGIDLFPTLADLTGGTIGCELPGRSLSPLLKGERPREDDSTIFASAAYSDLPADYFDHPEPVTSPDSDTPFHSRVERLTWQDERKTVMARTREWKFIRSETRPPELYHMNGGWIEKENVVGQRRHRKVRQTLERQVQELWPW